jgi:hypothetical protein
MNTTKLTPWPDYADRYTVSDFRENVKHDSFNSWDGSGYYATDEGYDHHSPVWQAVQGPHRCLNPAPGWATQVAWFNK